jgi:hypothetical protein
MVVCVCVYLLDEALEVAPFGVLHDDVEVAAAPVQN